MSGTRTVAFAALAAGASLGIVATAQPWWRAGAAGTEVPLTGTVVTAGLAQALPAVVGAGLLLSLALRARGRQVLGGVLALAGVAMIVLGLAGPEPTAETVRARLRLVSLAAQDALVATAWPLVYGAAGVLVLGGAALMATRARRWAAAASAARADRFSAAAAPPPAAAAGAPAGAAGIDPLLAWQALDAGMDPTEESAADPDYRSVGLGDTMGNEQDRDQTGSHP